MALNKRKEKKLGIKIATLELDSIGGKEFENNTRSLENRSRRLCRKCLKYRQKQGDKGTAEGAIVLEVVCLLPGCSPNPIITGASMTKNTT